MFGTAEWIVERKWRMRRGRVRLVRKGMVKGLRKGQACSGDAAYEAKDTQGKD